MDQLQILGYESHNPIVNLGTFAIFILLYLIKLCILYTVLKPFRERYNVIKKYYQNIYDQLIFSELLLLGLEGIFEILIACFLTFYAINTSMLK
jgi:hypothetical protein